MNFSIDLTHTENNINEYYIIEKNNKTKKKLTNAEYLSSNSFPCVESDEVEEEEEEDDDDDEALP